MKYGWLLQGLRTGQYVKLGAVDRITGKPDFMAVDTPAEATLFHSYFEASDIVRVHRSLGEHVRVIDCAIHEPQPADADQTPVPTREQIVAQALQDEEVRKAQRRANWTIREQ